MNVANAKEQQTYTIGDLVVIRRPKISIMKQNESELQIFKVQEVYKCVSTNYAKSIGDEYKFACTNINNGTFGSEIYVSYDQILGKVELKEGK